MAGSLAIIVGAGTSGLAASACLHVNSIPHILLEREKTFASLWNKYSYDRLHLHLTKQVCQLPHMPFPQSYPQYVPKDLFLQYLSDYVSKFNISPLYNRRVELAKHDVENQKWKVTARNSSSGELEEYSARFLIVASGESCDPFIPDNIEGLKSFLGEVFHSTKSKNGKAYHCKTVLVVGSGNSGMEIALDLANHGAKTSIIVRSPLLPAIERMRGNEVVFADGKSHPFDTIVLRTGFKRSTSKWLKDDGNLLNDDGISSQKPPNYWKGNNGLYCVGLAKSGFLGARVDALKVADDIKSLL